MTYRPEFTSKSPCVRIRWIIATAFCCLLPVLFLYREGDSNSTVQGTPSSSPDFRILIGIMSPYWASHRRQIVRNAYSRFPTNLPVDIVFVEGNITAEVNQDRARYAQQRVIEWENATYGDIIHLDCVENMNNGKTYEFLKKIGTELGHRYTHVMKSDDDAFINLPALVEVIRNQKTQEHLYWGQTYKNPEVVTWGRIDGLNRTEFWGCGYVLGMDLVKWIATSDIPKNNMKGLPEDWEIFDWLIRGKLDDNYVMNRTAFSEYPFPRLADKMYELWGEVQPYGRWVVVTHPLKEEWMFIETAEYYLRLNW